MVGWHHQFNGHELGQTLGDGEGQGSLACSSPQGWEESDTIWGINSITKTLSGVLYLTIQFSSVAQSCLTLVTPWTVVCQASLSMGILQVRILEWVAISYCIKIR